MANLRQKVKTSSSNTNFYDCVQVFVGTFKPVYNGHSWDLKKVAVWKMCLIKLIFRQVVDELNWPL